MCNPRRSVRVLTSLAQSACTLLICTMLALGLSGCQTGPGPDKTVQTMYESLGSGETDAYLDTMLPANRSVPDANSILIQLLGGASVEGYGFGLDLGGLLSPTFHDMTYHVATKKGRYALVEARGKVRSFAMEVPFCDSHDLVREGNTWYVDAFHTARQARLDRFLARNEQLYRAAVESGAVGADPSQQDPFSYLLGGGMFSEMSEVMKYMLDMCE